MCRVHSINYNALKAQNASLHWSLMCPGKLKDQKQDLSQAGPKIFTEELPIYLPAWLSKWNHLHVLAALLSIPQLSKFSVTLDDVAGAMVDDIRKGGMYSWLRVGMKRT